MTGGDGTTGLTASPATPDTTAPSAGAPDEASGGLLTAIAMGVMTLCTYGYLIVTARALGPATYGGFAAVMNLLAILNVAALGLQATAARRLASAPERRAQLAPGVSRITVQAAAGLTALALGLTPLVQRGLGLESVWTALLVGASVFPLTLVGGQLGILQGAREWHRLSVVYLAGGIPRVLLGALLMWWRPSEFNAVLAVFITLWAPVLAAWWFARLTARATPQTPESSLEPSARSTRGLLWESLHNVQALLAFLVLSNIDILVARAVLADHEAGLYAAGMMLARIMLVVSHSVATVMFPDLATPRARKRALGLGLGLVLACGTVATVGTRFLPDLALSLAGGAEYAETKDLLWRFTILGTVAAMVQFLIYSLIAMRVAQAIALTWVSLVALVLICAPARTVDGMVAAVTTVNLALLVVLLFLAVLAARPARQ